MYSILPRHQKSCNPNNPFIERLQYKIWDMYVNNRFLIHVLLLFFSASMTRLAYIFYVFHDNVNIELLTMRCHWLLLSCRINVPYFLIAWIKILICTYVDKVKYRVYLYMFHIGNPLSYNIMHTRLPGIGFFLLPLQPNG